MAPQEPSTAPAIQPEGSEKGTCPRCGHAVWWVLSTDGRSVLLDIEPDQPENAIMGDVEMVRVGEDWRAEQLAQRESLFEVPRLRWRLHLPTCPATDHRRSNQVPEQRKRG